MENFINTASNIPVVNGVAEIRLSLLAQNRIIDPANRLINSASGAITHHLDGTALLTIAEINTFLASSTLLHSLDGWSYLAHAVDSLLKGDSRIAIHLGYYSELRAAMSFLSSEGIGVFNHKYISVNAANNFQKNPVRDRITGKIINSSTHQFIWNALDTWLKSTIKPVIPSELLSIFLVDGKNFEQWLSNFPYASPLSGTLVLKKWLSSWNFDIGYFKDDREVRNIVSYQPPNVNFNQNAYSVNENIEKLTKFWNIIEPVGNSRFQLLDRYLLRDLLRMIYNSLTQTVRDVNPLEELIRTTITNLGLTAHDSFVNFLIARDDHDLFVESLNTTIDPTAKTLNPLSVIARATLMLRVATGNASRIFNDGGINKAQLDFFWDSYGLENGFWGAGGIPADFIDLWEDIRDEIEEVQTWADSRKPNLGLSSIYQDRTLPFSFNFFKQFHRAGLWGMSI